MTASNLRLSLLIGTQRYHGAGQNLAFTEGTQHIGLLACTGCGHKVNPETAWPGVCRLVVEGKPSHKLPQLTREGHFAFPDRVARTTRCPGDGRNPFLPLQEAADDLRVQQAASCASIEGSISAPGQRVVRATHQGNIPYTPGQTYALCCPDCGALLDRDHPEWHALAPGREALRRFSYRLSQLLIPAIDLVQIVAAWQLAIRDPAHMTVFCTDRLALPKSTTQTLTPAVLEAARGDYQITAPSFPNSIWERTCPGNSIASPLVNYAGLDMGDQCWFVARAIDTKAPHLARLLWAEPIAAERVRTRVPELVRLLNISALCVDAGPLRDLARDLVFMLNNLDEDSVPSSDDGAQNIYFRANNSARVARTTCCPGAEIETSIEAQEAATDSRAPSPAASCGGRKGFLPAPGQQVVRATQDISAPTLSWHAASQKWRRVRAMAVEFTQREGQGLRHKLARTQEGRLYPLLAANRDETIERVVQELLPPQAGDPRLIELPDGTAATAPTQRYFLPRATDETRAVLDTYERHLLAGAPPFARCPVLDLTRAAKGASLDETNHFDGITEDRRN